MISNCKSFIALLFIASSLTSSVNAARQFLYLASLYENSFTNFDLGIARQDGQDNAPVTLNACPTGSLSIVTVTEPVDQTTVTATMTLLTEILITTTVTVTLTPDATPAQTVAGSKTTPFCAVGEDCSQTGDGSE